MSAYRSNETVSSETIVIPMGRSRWWALVFVVPFALTFNDDLMAVAAPKAKGHPNG